jgi:hypothetical protein
MAKQRRKIAAAFRRMAGGVDDRAAYAATIDFWNRLRASAGARA